MKNLIDDWSTIRTILILIFFFLLFTYKSKPSVNTSIQPYIQPSSNAHNSIKEFIENNERIQKELRFEEIKLNQRFLQLKPIEIVEFNKNISKKNNKPKRFKESDYSEKSVHYYVNESDLINKLNKKSITYSTRNYSNIYYNPSYNKLYSSISTTHNSNYSIPSYSSYSTYNDVHVSGYVKQNGTYVNSYYRTAPNNTIKDNYSTYLNINPYTGKIGHIIPK